MDNEQETILLGIVGIKPKGEYNSETHYEKLNVVTYNGSSYCAKGDTTGNLPTNTDYWQLIAEKGRVGDDGPQGPQGVPGYTPVKGTDYYTDADKANLESDLADDVRTEVTSQLGDLVSATPLVASSTSGMTDTSRIYVNTTDGKWYYYDGDSWEIGGTYQSTGIGENEVEYTMLSEDIQNNVKNVLNENDVEIINTTTFEKGSISSSDGSEITSTTRIRSDYIDVSNSGYLHVKEPVDGYKYCIDFYLQDKTFIGSTLGGYYTTIAGVWKYYERYIILHPQIKYIRVLIADTSDSTNITPADKDKVSIYKNYLTKNNIYYNNLLIKSFMEWTKGNDYIFNNVGYSNGWVSGSTSTLSNVSDRIISNPIDVSGLNGYIKISTETGYKAGYVFLDSSFNVIITKYWNTSYEAKIPSNAKYLIVQGANDSESDITPAEGSNITIKFSATPNLQKIENIIDNELIDLGWEIGTLNPGYGTEGPSTARIRSGFIYAGKGTILEVDNTTYEHLYYMYDLTKTYVSDINWSLNPLTINKDCYIRVLLRKKNNATITNEEIPTIIATEKIYRAIPQSMIKVNDDIPSYFETNLSNAINNARNNILNAGINGDSFIFITDLHWQDNERHSPLLIKKIVDSLNINKIMCGGDLIGGGAKSSMINLMKDCINSYKGITRFYTIFGNHDSNHIGAPSSSDYFSKGETYALTQKQEDFNMQYGNPCYYYFDNPTTKTRYICLDTGLEYQALDNTQSTWLINTLNSMPSGYHALVFAHIIYQTTSTWHVGLQPSDLARTSFMNTVCDMLDNFNSNNVDKKVEAIIGGHVHIDCNFTTTGGIPIVLTGCDSKQTFMETYPGSGIRNNAIGTINEQCFDIITIDYTNRTIKCTRVGRGSNRTITY